MRKLAIITGATGGIGHAVTARLWREGYSLIVMGKTAEKVLALKHDPLFTVRQEEQYDAWMTADLTTDSLLHFEATLEMFPDHTPTLLVLCHGAAPAPGPAMHAWHTMKLVYETDVLGAFALCQLVGRHMLQQRHGSIVFVSSLHAKMTYPERLPYVVAKSAIVGMSKALAVEWGPQGVRSNVIVPWQVEGERSRRMIEAAAAEGYDLEEAYRQRSPMRRLIQPEEIADAVVFLSRNDACNGVEMVLDGGVSSSMWYQGFTQEMSEK